MRDQIEALPYRKPNDRAAVLTASIKESWNLPEPLYKKREQAAKAALRAAEIAAWQAKQEAKAQRAEQAQQSLQARWDALPACERAEWERKADAQHFQKSGNLWLQMRANKKIGPGMLHKTSLLLFQTHLANASAGVASA